MAVNQMPSPSMNHVANDVAAFVNFQVISLAYCTLTLTDGALRTSILLNAAVLGFTPTEIAAMFMLYEFLGIVINLFGGVSQSNGFENHVLAWLGFAGGVFAFGVFS